MLERKKKEKRLSSDSISKMERSTVPRGSALGTEKVRIFQVQKIKLCYKAMKPKGMVHKCNSVKSS